MSCGWRSPQPSTSSTGPVGRRRAVEREQAADAEGGARQLVVGAAHRDDGLRVDRHLAASGRLQAGSATAGRVRSRTWRWLWNGITSSPSDDLGRHPRHQRPERAEQHRRRAVRVRARHERRRHQRVGGVLAAEVEPGAVLPGGEDRPGGQHDLPHPRRRRRPRGAVPLLDVRLDLRAEPEPEPPARHQLQVPRGVGEVHRRARHRDRHVGHQVGLDDVRRDRERQEHVVRPLEREQPGRPGVHQLPGPRARRRPGGASSWTSRSTRAVWRRRCGGSRLLVPTSLTSRPLHRPEKSAESPVNRGLRDPVRPAHPCGRGRPSWRGRGRRARPCGCGRSRR